MLFATRWFLVSARALCHGTTFVWHALRYSEGRALAPGTSKPHQALKLLHALRVLRACHPSDVFLGTRWALASVLGVLTLAALPAVLLAQTGRSQRLLALQQQNAFQQQRAAVQNAVQQTAALVQAANRLNSLTPTATMTPINFLQQQIALETALQQTRALLQASRQQNPGLSPTALGQLNTLQAVLQQSIALQAALPGQGNLLTPAQLSQLSQQQPTLLRLLTNQPASSLKQMPAANSH